MLRDTRMLRARRWPLGIVLATALGLAPPCLAQEAPPAQGPAEEQSEPLDVFVDDSGNDAVVILSNGVPGVELRIREPRVRSYENHHAIGERTARDAIVTRGLTSSAIDVVYHGTFDYGQPSGIRTRRTTGTRVYQSIITHPIAAAGDGSAIRYHGSFR